MFMGTLRVEILQNESNLSNNNDLWNWYRFVRFLCEADPKYKSGRHRDLPLQVRS